MKKLSKLEEYELNLRVKNICKSFETNWRNTPEKSQKVQEDFSFRNINLIPNPELRDLFIECSKTTKKGQIRQLVRKSKFDFNVFYRTKKKYKIPNFEFTENRQGIESKVIELYIINKLSTSQIAKEINFCDQSVNNILRKNNIEIRPNSYTNLERYPTKQNYSFEELFHLLYLKYYLQKKTIKQIAKELKIDQGTVSKRLKFYGFEIKLAKPMSGERRKCLWCKSEFEAYISTGIRSQKFCSNSCKNKAKDLRRNKGTPQRIDSMITKLQQIWGDKFPEVIKNICPSNKPQGIDFKSVICAAKEVEL